VTTCDQYGNTDINGKIYVVQNGMWNPSPGGTQCLSVDNVTGAYTVTTQTNISTNGSPASYPFIYQGCHFGYCTTGSDLPLQVGKIKTAQSSWSVTTISTGVWNVAFDIWINTTPTTPNGADGAEIMIWLNSRSMTPYGHNEGTTLVSGSPWSVTHTKFDVPFIVYRSKTDLASVSNLGIKAFLDDAVSRGWIESDWYLISVEAGFELWSGGEGMRTNSFSFTASSIP